MPKTARPSPSEPLSNNWEETFRDAVIGQDHCLKPIIEAVAMAQMGLNEPGRPIANIMMLGPTGTGKTKTAEALAYALHGSEKNILIVNCGEFQMDHEVAKLIGAPPGYLGHRETAPMISTTALRAVTSDRSSLAIVLLDEIEKAAPSMTRLLLGVLDKATLRLGDNNVVKFDDSLILMTSNLGAKAITEKPMGFAQKTSEESLNQDIQKKCMSAVRSKFPPEFINRIDSFTVYSVLSRDVLSQILDIELAKAVSRHTFSVVLSDAARERILDESTSTRFGAREMRRLINQHVIRALPRMITSPMDLVGARFALDGDLILRPASAKPARG